MSSFLPITWTTQWSPSIKVFFSSSLTSATKNHRALIRAEILHFLMQEFDLSLEEQDEFLNLENLPRCRFGTISVSHSPLGSAFAFDANNRKLGVDVEDSNRITLPILKRIRNSKDCTFNETAVFSMKEAAWKALNFKDRQLTLASVVLDQVKPASVSEWSFQAQSENAAGQGYCRLQNNLQLACFYET